MNLPKDLEKLQNLQLQDGWPHLPVVAAPTCRKLLSVTRDGTKVYSYYLSIDGRPGISLSQEEVEKLVAGVAAAGVYAVAEPPCPTPAIDPACCGDGNNCPIDYSNCPHRGNPPAPETLDPQDLRIDTWCKATGGWSTQVHNCCRILHLPTGITVESEGARSLHAAKTEALRKLSLKVRDFLLKIPKTPPRKPCACVFAGDGKTLLEVCKAHAEFIPADVDLNAPGQINDALLGYLKSDPQLYTANDLTTAENRGYQSGLEMGKALAADEAAPATQQADAQDDDLILIPRGLIGAACYAVRKLNPDSKLLLKLREYTTGSKSTHQPDAAKALKQATAPGQVRAIWRGDDTEEKSFNRWHKQHRFLDRAAARAGWKGHANRTYTAFRREYDHGVKPNAATSRKQTLEKMARDEDAVCADTSGRYPIERKLVAREIAVAIRAFLSKQGTES